MKKIKKRYLIPSIIAVSLVGILLIGTQILEQKIEEKLTENLENLFQPKLDGFEMNLSFINYFPHPSIVIEDLGFSEVLDDTLRHILHVEEAKFLLDFGELFNNNFVFKGAELQKGFIKFFTNYKGEKCPNFPISD